MSRALVVPFPADGEDPPRPWPPAPRRGGESSERRINRSGIETILLVDDDPSVRTLVLRMLHPLGYRVLEASDGRQAVAIADTFEGFIHLVLCDIIVPDLGGPEIVSEVQARSGQTKALFMSGHTNHVLLQDGLLQNASNFIKKPFTSDDLATKVREVLDT